MNPKISIIIPVYNKEEYIGRCLDSILHQTFQDFEIIVIDDCSLDKSKTIIENKAAAHKNIKIIYHDKNMGTMKARESGYRIAEGDYLVFVDSDDTLPENALQILYCEITKSGADIIMSGFQYITPMNQQKTTQEVYSLIGEYSSEEVFYLLLKGLLRHNLWSCIFNANLFSQELVCLQNQTNGEDLILFYQLVGNSNIIKIINTITYNYHLEGESATRSHMSKNKIEQFVTTRNFKYHYLLEKGIDNNSILQNIAKEHISNHRYKTYRNTNVTFDPEILDYLQCPHLFKNLSLKHIIKYFLFKLGVKSID